MSIKQEIITTKISGIFGKSSVSPLTISGKMPVTLLNKSRPERFKTQAAHFPVQRDERTGMQRATLGKSGSNAAP